MGRLAVWAACAALAGCTVHVGYDKPRTVEPFKPGVQDPVPPEPKHETADPAVAFRSGPMNAEEKAACDPYNWCNADRDEREALEAESKRLDVEYRAARDEAVKVCPIRQANYTLGNGLAMIGDDGRIREGTSFHSEAVLACPKDAPAWAQKFAGRLRPRVRSPEEERLTRRNKACRPFETGDFNRIRVECRVWNHRGVAADF